MIGRPDDPAATYALLVGIPFDVAGRRRAWDRESRLLVSEAEARVRVTENDVRAEAREAYTAVALADALLEVASQSEATAAELLARVEARLRASAATALDVALSESQHAEARADVERAQRTLVEAQDRFRQALDLPPSSAVRVAGLDAPVLPEGLTLEAALVRARARRGEVAVWTSTRERFEASDKRLRREAVAPVQTSLEYERQGNHNVNQSVGASVGVELPFVQKNQGERAVARMEARAADVERELVEHAIEREVATSFQRLEAALRELALLDERAVPAAERTLTMVRTLLEAGAVDYFRLLSAQSGAFALRKRRVETLREAWACRVALERAIGGWEAAR